VPVPQPEADAWARMQPEREVDRKRPGMLRRPLGILHTGPDVSMAAQSGKPNLAPPSETSAGTETLVQGSKPTVGSSTGGTSAGGNTAYVERVTPGPTVGTPAAGTTASTPGAETPAKPDSSSPDVKPPTDPSQASDNKDKKPDQDKKDDDKNKKESSSKKKKGLRKIIPW
jgi:hypothetical protein